MLLIYNILKNAVLIAPYLLVKSELASPLSRFISASKRNFYLHLACRVQGCWVCRLCVTLFERLVLLGQRYCDNCQQFIFPSCSLLRYWYVALSADTVWTIIFFWSKHVKFATDMFLGRKQLPEHESHTKTRVKKSQFLEGFWNNQFSILLNIKLGFLPEDGLGSNHFYRILTSYNLNIILFYSLLSFPVLCPCFFYRP